MDAFTETRHLSRALGRAITVAMYGFIRCSKSNIGLEVLEDQADSQSDWLRTASNDLHPTGAVALLTARCFAIADCSLLCLTVSLLPVY